MTDYISFNALADWAVHTGLAVTALILLVLLIRKPVARYLGAKAAYALWFVPLARLFVPVIVLPAKPTDSVGITETPAPVFILEEAARPAIEAPSIEWAPVLVSVWITGAAIWLILQMVRQAAYHRNLKRHSRQPDHALNTVIKQAQDLAGLNRRPDIRVADDRHGPLVTGLMRPLVILPDNFERGYSLDQQRLALVHEFSHIRRGDLWAASAALIFRALNWPNPVIHFAATQFRTDQEAACDQSVLDAMSSVDNARQTYAETLVQAARSSVAMPRPVPMGLTIYHPLKERLMRLENPTSKAGLMSRALTTTLLCGAVLVSAPFTRADASNDALAGAPDTTMKVTSNSKQVIKWTEEVDGKSVSKHYEILTEDGQTKAFEIDEIGNRFEVDPDSIEGVHKHGDNLVVFKHGTVDIKGLDGLDALDGQHANIFVKKMEGGPQEIEVRKFIGADGKEHHVIKEFIGQSKGEWTSDAFADGQNAKVFAFSSDENINFDFSTDGKAKGLVGAAQSLVEQAEKSDDLSRDAKRKLEKALKALEEAEAALAKE